MDIWPMSKLKVDQKEKKARWCSNYEFLEELNRKYLVKPNGLKEGIHYRMGHAVLIVIIVLISPEGYGGQAFSHIEDELRLRNLDLGE